MSDPERDAAWDSAIYNAKRAEAAEKRIAELEAQRDEAMALLRDLGGATSNADHYRRAQAFRAENERLREMLFEEVKHDVEEATWDEVADATDTDD